MYEQMNVSSVRALSLLTAETYTDVGVRDFPTTNPLGVGVGGHARGSHLPTVNRRCALNKQTTNLVCYL